jgi:uncharacterized membrane protein (GlpM family)
MDSAFLAKIMVKTKKMVVQGLIPVPPFFDYGQ